MSQLNMSFILLLVYQVKHYLADYVFQRGYMLQKSSPNWDFIWPLSLHCGVHASLTLLICLILNPSLWWLAGVDFGIHFVMDRIKSGPRYLGRFNDRSKAAYWNSFGLDQMVHHLTHILIVWILVSHLS